MAEPVRHPPAIRNHLLAALPSGVLAAVRPQMQAVTLGLRDVVYAAEAPVTAVHFIENGWASLVMRLDDARTAEVGLVGREGMLGLPIVFGVDFSYVEAMVQGAGTALRMEAGAFRQALEEHPPLRALLCRYGEFMHAQATQSAACNGNHGLEQRLARWLLVSHDRANGDDLPMTQDFMASMLCVHRPSVTTVARALQEAKLIRYSNGTVTVVDRPGLEAASCGCHAAIRRQYRKLLG